MDLLKNMNRAMEYIEENLTDEIDFKEVARAAFCSEYHFKSLNKEKINKLKQLSNVEPRGLIQASTNFSEERMEEKGGLDHYIGVATTNECPESFSRLEVPALTWAVFEVIGTFPNTLQETWGRIYSEWFPSTRYQQTEGPEILSIKSKDLTSPTVKSEIWIPVLRT